MPGRRKREVTCVGDTPEKAREWGLTMDPGISMRKKSL